jgi:hypothetical protein
MIPLNLIRPIIETVVNSVIAIEKIFGAGNGINKKKEALQNAGKSAYDIFDGVLNLDDKTDEWAMQLIERAVDSAVDYFNYEKEGQFEDGSKEGAIVFVHKELGLG